MMAAPTERLFGGQAEIYDRFRPPYPAALYDVLLDRTEGRDLAIDLGAGTGKSMTPLMGTFRRLMAIEPDPGMAARLPASPSLTIVGSRAEDAALPVGEVDLAISGTAFHWLDGPRVLARLAQAMKPGGVFGVFTYNRPDPGPAGKKVAEAEFGARWNRFKNDRLGRHDYAPRQLAAAPGWQAPERIRIANDFEMTAAELAGFYATTSYGAAFMASLDDPAAYLDDLSARFAQAIGRDPFPVTLPVELVLSRPVKGA